MAQKKRSYPTRGGGGRWGNTPRKTEWRCAAQNPYPIYDQNQRYTLFQTRVKISSLVQTNVKLIYRKHYL